MNNPQNTAPDFGEPWEHKHANNFKDRDGQLFLYGWGFSERIVDCVNACQGMPDPAAEIEVMRAAIREAYVVLASISGESGKIWEANEGLPNNAKIQIQAEEALAKLKPFMP